MTRSVRAAAISAVLILLAAAGRADWPRWRGANADGRAPADAIAPKALAAAPTIAWQVPIGVGIASPIVAGGRVYAMDAVGDKETIHALNAATGQEIWRAEVGPVYTDFQSKPGPRCTPIADGDRVYAQSCVGELLCLNARDGKIVWRCSYQKDLGAAAPAESGDNLGAARHGFSCSPVIDGNRIVANVGAPGAGVVCWNKLTGAVIWKSQDDPPGHVGPITGTIGGVRQVIVYSAIALMGLDVQTGALLWRMPLKSRYGRHATTPILCGDTVVVGSITFGLTGVRVTKDGPQFKAERTWTHSDLGVSFASPVALGKLVYGLGPGNRLFCVDAATGAKVFVKDGFFSGLVSTEFCAMIAWPGLILGLCDGGNLVTIALTPTDARITSKAPACGANWCHPAIFGGRVLVQDGQKLTCLEIARK
jgi:outer membrane protein assembly factor BamB